MRSRAVLLYTSCRWLRLHASPPLSSVRFATFRRAELLPVAPLCRYETVTVSAVSDKKFHCSICKKAYRLEQAARLHLAQAHGGEGTVEAGPGPGQTPEAPSTPAARNVAQPVPRQELSGSSQEEERRPRRMRGTPKPLHTPDVQCPPAAMSEMLAVWDKIGVARVDSFVHSSMILTVFAAKPSDAPTGPAYEPSLLSRKGITPLRLPRPQSISRTEKQQRSRSKIALR